MKATAAPSAPGGLGGPSVPASEYQLLIWLPCHGGQPLCPPIIAPPDPQWLCGDETSHQEWGRQCCWRTRRAWRDPSTAQNLRSEQTSMGRGQRGQAFLDLK